jgi:predicted aspartyl protease
MFDQRDAEKEDGSNRSIDGPGMEHHAVEVGASSVHLAEREADKATIETYGIRFSSRLPLCVWTVQ